ncbi:MAG: hypothetical protein Unbinned2691contig1000_36 [Prokaryotic dsDNA virus sp.]|nr:MAG: hypothetical protein Unbinned2691contig1000_36 [Prokaryotic dsDNA virus sp.]
MPNPSEETRKQHEELEHHRNCVRNLGLSKKSREYHLGQIRHLCNQLGEGQPGNYNG